MSCTHDTVAGATTSGERGVGLQRRRPRLSDGSARAILASIVLIATLLAGAWAFLVPIMQDPDESAHIDYAFSILTARRVSLPAGRSISTDVHPYTRYLEASSGFRGMRYSSYGRVPSGYGTRTFFARVDAGAPHVTPASGDKRPLPLYASVYPFGFYALEAIVMAATGLLLPGSLVAQFFAARLFCVALLAPTLVCSYGIFRYLRLGRTLALTLTATIAFFPLTSSIFSYVQPDDLVAALVASGILATLHFRDNPNVRTASTVGALLAALALTKFHYALVLLVVVLLMTFASKRIRSELAYVIAPTATAFAIGAYAMWLPPTTHRLLCAELGAPLHAALEAGSRAYVPYVATTAATFFGDTFVGGWPFVEYWGAVGWIPHIVIIGSPAVTTVAIDCLRFATISMLIVMLMRAVVVLKRLGIISRARGFGTAFRVLSRDVALNVYVTYLLFMLGANIYSANLLEHGRYWLPFIACALLSAVRFIPHFVNPRFERPLALCVAAVLATYSAVTALPALDTVKQSYYVPRASVPYVEQFANFDRATTERFASAISPGDRVVMSGYAVDSPSEAAARGASLLVDGKRRIALDYGAPRDDVVCTFNDVSLARTGFRGTFSTAGLSPGRHSIELQVAESEFAAPVRTANRISFVIEPGTYLTRRI